MDGRRQQLAALRVDIAKGSKDAGQLNQLKQRVGEKETQLEGLKSNLPEQKDVADLLRRIQTLAVQSNLTIRGFKPSPSVTKSMHAEWPIMLNLDGTYHNLGMFFDRVSKFSRVININNIQIRAKQSASASGTSTITADCVATTFVLLEQKPAAAAAVKKSN
jgi:type IV pilus assembly protein PilO